MPEASINSASAIDNPANADKQVDSANFEFSLRLKDASAKNGWNQKDLARRSGVPAARISEYWNGDRVPSVWYLFAIANALAVTPEWLFMGSGPSNTPDRVEIQEIDLAYGLGSAYTDGPIETQSLTFPREWIERITLSPPTMLTIARGRGDSMQPTIQDGDMVLIDRSQRTVREQDAIWALTIGELGMIKRIRAGGERIKILSDNDRVPPDEVHHEEINIVGRVIFIGRKI